MYGKKGFDKRYLLIIIVVVIALLLVIVSVALNKNRNLNPIEKLVKDSGTFIINVVSAPVNLIKNVASTNSDKKDVYEKYKKLKAKEEQINSVIADNDNLKDEVNSLKKQLELNTILSDKVYKNVTVINRNVGYWYTEVTIDKGKTEGIEKNMAVVNYKGLVGVVTKVSNYVSTVKLLANENMTDKISVKIKVNDRYVYGLISNYNSKNNSYTVEGISENIDIPTNSEVVTTGMGGTYPSGLLVGNVTKTATDNFDLSKVAIVKSSVDFNDITYLTVLKRKDK